MSEKPQSIWMQFGDVAVRISVHAQERMLERDGTRESLKDGYVAQAPPAEWRVKKWECDAWLVLADGGLPLRRAAENRYVAMTYVARSWTAPKVPAQTPTPGSGRFGLGRRLLKLLRGR